MSFTPQQQGIVIDFETKGLFGEFLCFSVCDMQGQHVTTYTNKAKVVELFSEYTGHIWAYNASYEYLYAKHHLGVDVSAQQWWCARLLAHTINHNYTGQHSGLGFVASTLLPIEQQKLEYHPEGGWENAEVTDELLEYNRQDVLTTAMLIPALLNSVGKFINKNYAPSKRENMRQRMLAKLEEVFPQRNRMLFEVIAPATHHGLYMDKHRIAELQTQIDTIVQGLGVVCVPTLSKGEVVVKKAAKNVRYIMSHYGGEPGEHHNQVWERCDVAFKPLASKTDKAVVFAALRAGLPQEYINKAGNIEIPPGATEDESAQQEGSVVWKVKVGALLGTISGYFKNWHLHCTHKDDKYMVAHSNIDLCGTLTGRVSSSKPNILNVGGSNISSIECVATIQKQLRKCVVAPPGYKVVGADIDRAELVILARILEQFGDPKLKELVNANEDIHQYNADLWGLTRLQAKRLVFSIMYGATKFKVAEICSTTPDKGEDIINTIKQRMPALSRAMEYYTKLCEQLGGVYDLLGDFKAYPMIRSKNKAIRARTERQLFNAVIQGTNASIITLLTPQIQSVVAGYGGQLVSIIYDEVLTYVPEQHAEEAVEVLNNRFNERFDVPGIEGLRFGMLFASGDSWYDVK